MEVYFNKPKMEVKVEVGNAPEFRCYVEAAGQADAERLLHAALELIKAAR